MSSPPRGRSPPRSSRRPTRTLFVGNIPYRWRERDLADVFERCGRIRGITLGWNRRLNEPRGHAFVEFDDIRDAEDAFHRYQNYDCEGRRLRLDFDVGLENKIDQRRDYDYGSRRRSRSPPRRRSRTPERRRSRTPERRDRTPPPRRTPSPPRAQAPPAAASAPPPQAPAVPAQAPSTPGEPPLAPTNVQQ